MAYDGNYAHLNAGNDYLQIAFINQTITGTLNTLSPGVYRTDTISKSISTVDSTNHEIRVITFMTGFRG